jgi:hypothetical protein
MSAFSIKQFLFNMLSTKVAHIKLIWKKRIVRNFEIIHPSYANQSFLYRCDVRSFYHKLEMIRTKVSKEEFYLVDMVSPTLLKTTLICTLVCKQCQIL